MFAWARIASRVRPSDELAVDATAEEVARRTDLRRRYAAWRYREQGIDERRLEFARWLVRSGRLSEGEDMRADGRL